MGDSAICLYCEFTGFIFNQNNECFDEGNLNIKVCIIAVCYNAHEDAKRLLDSIELAIAGPRAPVDLLVVLSDNSSSVAPHDLIGADYSFNYSYLTNENIGYFPAFNAGIKSLNFAPSTFDYIAVSNVDLLLDKSFFVNLAKLQADPDVGVIAPKIRSLSNGRDLNPKMLGRPGVKQIKLARAIFVYPVLFKIYNAFTRLKEYLVSKNQKVTAKGSPPVDGYLEMYGAHGSFIIFTKNYFLAGASIDYPRFLFGEEGFVAEQAMAQSLKVIHAPQIIIHDREHGTTSQQPSAFMCREHVNSYDYYLNTFRRDEF